MAAIASLRHLHAVGPHVGDQADGLAADVHALVQLLRHPHRRLRAEAELAAGVHLEAGRGERRLRVALDPAPLDGGDAELPGLHRRLGRRRLRGVVQVELVEPLPSRWVSRAVNGAPAGRGEMRLHRPVLAGAERLDLGFPLADQAQRHGLHAPGGAAARQLAPQHGGEGEAHQVVQRAAGQVGLDQRLVQRARMRHGVLHGGFGDLVEGDALHVDAAAAPSSPPASRARAS